MSGEREIRVHIGCLPILLFLALVLAAIYWLGLGALWILAHGLATITALGAGPP
jgi:hypothetical protein